MVTGTSRSGVMAQVRTKPVQDTMSNVDSVMHEVGCTEICGVSPTKNQSGKTFVGQKIPRKILKKILRTYYLCSLGIKVFIVFARR